MTDILLTDAVKRRAQQRGVPLILLETVYRHGDIEMPAGRGRTALALSYLAARHLAGIGAWGIAERARGIVLILDGPGVVGVLRASPGARRRRLSRDR